MLTRIFLNNCRVYSRFTTEKMGKNKGKTEKMIAITMNGSNKEKPEDGAISMNKNGEIILRIHAKPNAKTTRVVANETLINTMMDILGLRKNEITFDTGTRSRSKVLRLNSKRFTLEEVREKLERNAIGKG